MNGRLLADFVLDTDYSDLPPHVVAQAKRCLMDLVGVAAAGSTTDLWKQQPSTGGCFSTR